MNTEPSVMRLIPFYHAALDALEAARVPFLVAGSYALWRYAGIARQTKDLDICLTQADCPKALEAARAAGFETSVEAPHWLAKIRGGEEVVDVIYNSGNGLAAVDEGWFAHAVEVRLDDRRVKLAPAEEMIWQKGFIMERHRYDGADIAHLLRARGEALDWQRLLDRFASHWPVLLCHLSLFHYIYPFDRRAVPAWVLRELSARLELQREAPAPADGGVCQGTFLSNFEYVHDLRSLRLRDARLKPEGPLTADELEVWNRHLGTGLHPPFKLM